MFAALQVCFIKTTNLDGESNLKIRRPVDLKENAPDNIKEVPVISRSVIYWVMYDECLASTEHEQDTNLTFQWHDCCGAGLLGKGCAHMTWWLAPGHTLFLPLDGADSLCCMTGDVNHRPVAV